MSSGVNVPLHGRLKQNDVPDDQPHRRLVEPLCAHRANWRLLKRSRENWAQLHATVVQSSEAGAAPVQQQR